MQWQALPHPGAPNVHAAGTRAGLLAARQQADAVISGDYGPNCYVVLEAAGIPMYLHGACRTAGEAVERFRAGQLRSVNAPTRSGPSAEQTAG